MKAIYEKCNCLMYLKKKVPESVNLASIFDFDTVQSSIFKFWIFINHVVSNKYKITKHDLGNKFFRFMAAWSLIVHCPNGFQKVDCFGIQSVVTLSGPCLLDLRPILLHTLELRDNKLHFTPCLLSVKGNGGYVHSQTVWSWLPVNSWSFHLFLVKV